LSGKKGKRGGKKGATGGGGKDPYVMDSPEARLLTEKTGFLLGGGVPLRKGKDHVAKKIAR